MKNKYIALLMSASLSLLSACGGGSSTTASTTPATDYSAIWQAIIDHPDQAMEIAPTSERLSKILSYVLICI